MTPGELGTICGAIITGLSGVGAVVKWAANSITEAIRSGHAIVERNTQALLGFTASTVRLEGLITGAHQAAEKTQEAVEEIAEEVSAVHEAAPIETFYNRKPTNGR